MKRITIVGYGNIGRAVLDAIEAAPDMECAGVVLRDRTKWKEKGVPAYLTVAEDVHELHKVDAALLCVPSRSVPDDAIKYLSRGIHTVDSYDLHGDAMVDLRQRLDAAGKAYGSVAVIGAGWDPGVNSMIRGIFEFSAPRGITYTNYGPGMSMGHTVAAKAIKGVRNALSVTIPLGTGLHRRMVYIELETGYDFTIVAAAIKTDGYFAKDETHVMQVEDVTALQDVGHGVNMVRKGASGRIDNQQFTFDMRINNPALTAQIMVAAARAACRQSPGCYTLLDIPIASLLYDDESTLTRRLI
ncbi:MAG: diaminopimelate dehydrogenase [Defluviitaleaceae bacterium]|nr:diaminopimelate dehydrogenase [Defluviitaleaceae bacterium]